MLICVNLWRLKLSFPKSRRLTRTAEFQGVREEGKLTRGTLVSVAIAAAPTQRERFRVGIITSRKVGSAVIRNRVRRRIREIVRRHQHRIKSGIWMVIIASVRASRASYAELEHEWLRLAARALS